MYNTYITINLLAYKRSRNCRTFKYIDTQFENFVLLLENQYFRYYVVHISLLHLVALRTPRVCVECLTFPCRRHANARTHNQILITVT